MLHRSRTRNSFCLLKTLCPIYIYVRKQIVSKKRNIYIYLACGVYDVSYSVQQLKKSKHPQEHPASPSISMLASAAASVPPSLENPNILLFLFVSRLKLANVCFVLRENRTSQLNRLRAELARARLRFLSRAWCACCIPSKARGFARCIPERKNQPSQDIEYEGLNILWANCVTQEIRAKNVLRKLVDTGYSFYNI